MVRWCLCDNERNCDCAMGPLPVSWAGLRDAMTNTWGWIGWRAGAAQSVWPTVLTQHALPWTFDSAKASSNLTNTLFSLPSTLASLTERTQPWMCCHRSICYHVPMVQFVTTYPWLGRKTKIWFSYQEQTLPWMCCHDSICHHVPMFFEPSYRLSWSNRNFFGAYHHRYHSKYKKGTLWWEARRSAWNTRFGIEQRRWNQDAVQPIEHQPTSPRKCVQQEWSSTDKTADAVGNAFQTAGRWWPSASAGTRSAYRNRHKLVFTEDIPSHPKWGYVRILAESLLWEKCLGKTRIRSSEGPTTCMEPLRGCTIASTAKDQQSQETWRRDCNVSPSVLSDGRTVFGKHCECIAQKCTHLERLPPLASQLLLLSHCVLSQHGGQKKKVPCRGQTPGIESGSRTKEGFAIYAIRSVVLNGSYWNRKQWRLI